MQLPCLSIMIATWELYFPFIGMSLEDQERAYKENQGCMSELGRPQRPSRSVSSKQRYGGPEEADFPEMSLASEWQCWI